MKVLSVNNNLISNNRKNNTSFKSNLPNAYARHSLYIRDYWEDFTKQCMNENKLDKLSDLLRKLKSNFDKNVLALTVMYTQEFKPKELSIANYKFSLHRPLENIDQSGCINSSVDIKEKYYYDKAEEKDKLVSRTVNKDVETNEKESTADVLLKVLREIITPKTDCNQAIYGYKDTKEEHFLKDFRI